jgi:type IV pilus assembly protein PilC
MTTLQTFAYEAVDRAGLVQKGVIESDSQDKVVQQLASQRLIPINVAVHGSGLQREIKLPGLRGRTNIRDLAILSRQFASMTSSGLSLIRSLSILEDQALKPGLKEALSKVRQDVQGGSTLSKAVAQHPDHFPPLMIDMVRAGETGGFLDDALDRIAKMYEADSNLRAKIRSALTYPVIVLIFSILMGVGVIVFIVPIFERMFKNLGGNLPLPTRILVELSHNMIWIGPVVLVALLVAARTIRSKLRRDYDFRLRIDRWKLRLPVFGSLFTKLAISRWARNLATLISVGVPLLKALDIVGGASGSGVVAEAMKDVRDGVREGQQMSVPLSRHPLFPAMVVQMIEVGEETGQIVAMLDKVADYYDREVESATESLTSALEPIMVVMMGAVIGTMVICLYLPMFTIYQHIQDSH